MMSPSALDNMTIVKKPKLGFTIDELVGNTSPSRGSPNCETTISARDPGVVRGWCTKNSPSTFDDISPATYAVPLRPDTGIHRLGLTSAGNFLPSNCLPSPQPQFHPALPFVLGREAPTVFPWLLGRHGRFFAQRLQGSETSTFLFHPFRKPKRIRTAFSPVQLLQLERAFERNHYVVGGERRQLARNLDLTETQVKVWFQNRRTKHKRQKQEDDHCCQNTHSNHGEEKNSSDEESVSLHPEIDSSADTEDGSTFNVDS